MAERGERWSDYVEFTEGDALAYRPREVLVPEADGAEAERLINQRQPSRGDEDRRQRIDDTSFTLIPDVDDTLSVVGELRARGILAQPNHVLFSHCLCCGCGPHPSAFWSGSYAGLWAYPFGANPFGANPFGANPFGANPFGANPFGANPFGANPFGANPFGANPFGANPFGANPFGANPADGNVEANPAGLVASGRGGPGTTAFRATGLRRHSARPANPPILAHPPALQADAHPGPTIVVVDTGIAEGDLRPAALTGVTPRASLTRPDLSLPPVELSAAEIPDEDPADQRIDPVAGHGTFIAGIIDRIVPSAVLEVYGLLNGRGDASETDIVATLNRIGQQTPPGALVNLSFGGYTSVEMGALAEAVSKLQKNNTVVVASAGNDATCRPSYPAAFPGVVSVGALGPSGPAHFTNYGPWVRACAPGVDVVSTFFHWEPGPDDGDLKDWVRWSGTSFAAPAVVGALARAMGDGTFAAGEAVERVIDDPGLFRFPGLGTVVNQTPWFMR
jgi:Subtilase family